MMRLIARRCALDALLAALIVAVGVGAAAPAALHHVCPPLR